MATATTASAPRSLLPNELGPIIRLWLRRDELPYWEIDHFCEDFQTARLLNLSVSLSGIEECGQNRAAFGV
jgi:hypothetical protein